MIPCPSAFAVGILLRLQIINSICLFVWEFLQFKYQLFQLVNQFNNNFQPERIYIIYIKSVMDNFGIFAHKLLNMEPSSNEHKRKPQIKPKLIQVAGDAIESQVNTHPPVCNSMLTNIESVQNFPQADTTASARQVIVNHLQTAWNVNQISHLVTNAGIEIPANACNTQTENKQIAIRDNQVGNDQISKKDGIQKNQDAKGDDNESFKKREVITTYIKISVEKVDRVQNLDGEEPEQWQYQAQLSELIPRFLYQKTASQGFLCFNIRYGFLSLNVQLPQKCMEYVGYINILPNKNSLELHFEQCTEGAEIIMKRSSKVILDLQQQNLIIFNPNTMDKGEIMAIKLKIKQLGFYEQFYECLNPIKINAYEN